MTVYVDDMRATYGRMIMCHMMADTKEELLAMVDTIGVSRKWIQKEGTVYEHFDISLGKKALAIENGAVELTRREFYKKMMEKRNGRPTTSERDSREGEVSERQSEGGSKQGNLL